MSKTVSDHVTLPYSRHSIRRIGANPVDSGSDAHAHYPFHPSFIQKGRINYGESEIVTPAQQGKDT